VGNSAGAGNSGSACPQVPPCGGDLLGDWTIVQACIDVPSDLFSDICAGSTVKVSSFTATGTVSFKADKTTVSSGVISFVQTTQLPASCVSEAQCAASGAAFANDPRYSNGQCQYDASTGCLCTVTSTQTPMNSGTYEVQGTDVILSSSNGKMSVDSFCVSGNTLSLYETNANANGATSTLTLTR